MVITILLKNRLRRHGRALHFPHGYLEYNLHQKLVYLLGDDKSVVKLEVLHNMSNEINSNFKSTNLSFLNVIANERKTRILTDMYYKLTDTHTKLLTFVWNLSEKTIDS